MSEAFRTAAAARGGRARLRAARGFTYVAIMIFVAILALVSATVLSAGAALQRRMQEEELLFVGQQFAEAFKSYFEATPAGQRNYPAKLEELLRDPRYPGVRRHLRKLYIDPMTGKPEWGVVAAPGGIIGVHSFSQRAPLKVAEFEPAFAVLADKKSYVDWKFGFAPPGLVIAVPLAGTVVPITKPSAQKPAAPPAGVAPAAAPGALPFTPPMPSADPPSTR